MAGFLERLFVSALEEDKKLQEEKGSPCYRLAFNDRDFLLRRELRPVRLQLELLKPELLHQEMGVSSTIAIFGSARIVDKPEAEKALEEARQALDADPNNKLLALKAKQASRLLAKARYYDEARELARIISRDSNKPDGHGCVVVTGGGPGIMEAANRGAHDEKAKNVGLNIVLPMEQEPNPYITPELCFNFHYFAIRKMHFLMRAQAVIAFPGGFGTLDEICEVLTLLQTGKVNPLPVLLFGREYWEKIINFDALVDEGVVSPEDMELFSFVETAAEAWEAIVKFFKSDAANT